MMRRILTVLFLLVWLVGISFSHTPAASLSPAPQASETSQTNGNGQGVSLVADLPANDGAKLLVAAIYVSYDLGIPTPELTAPTGWTALSSFGSNLQFIQLFFRFGNGATSATWTASQTMTKATYWVAAYTGANTTAPINANAGSSTSANIVHNAPSVTTSVANCLVVCFWGANNVGATFLTPVSMNERFNQPADFDINALAIADSLQATPGATGLRAATSNSGNHGANYTVAIAPAAAPPPAQAPAPRRVVTFN
jgi:hypothetical protein